MYGDKKKINGTAKHLINTTELSDITLKWTGKRPKKNKRKLLGKLSSYTDTFEKNRLIEIQKKKKPRSWKKEQGRTES